MSHTTRSAFLIACGLALSCGLASGQPRGVTPLKLEPGKAMGSVDPAEVGKMYGHLTLDEINGWWKKMPSTEAEANQAHQDIAEAVKQFEVAERFAAAGQAGKAADAMRGCVAGFLKQFQPDAVPVADVYGVLGVYLTRAGDVAGADDAFRKQRACMDKAFPVGRFPDGHPRLALFLLTTGSGQLELGRSGPAEAAFRDALRMYLKKGPANPNGSDLTTLYIRLTSAVFARNEFVEADGFATEALTRCEKLCESPEGKTAFSHLLAKAKNNLGEVRRARGNAARARGDEVEAKRFLSDAERLLGEAVAVSREVGGRGNAGMKLRNQAALALGNRDFTKALALSSEALLDLESAYPAAENPKGHPDLVSALRMRGQALTESGRSDEARQVYARCLEMIRGLFPDDRCPDGHPELAGILYSLGDLHLRSPLPEDQRAAAQYYRDSLQISLGHTRAQAAYLSEVGMLQQITSASDAACGLLSVSRPFDSRDYWYLWEAKSSVMRVLDHRRRLAVKSSDPAVQEILRQLSSVREELSRHALAPSTDPAVRAADLSTRKENLEAQLAAAQGLPLPARGVVGPVALSQNLPPNAAFIDFWAYAQVSQDPADPAASGRRKADHYAAFVITRDRDVFRVELGPADAIDRTVQAWVAQIVQNPPDPVVERQSAKAVASLVWEPLRGRLPNGIDTVYICPDGSFGRLPFGALPDATGTKVLLEDMKIVEVPHGAGLHARLTSPPPARTKGPVLAIGAVQYGPGRWEFLGGTEKEVRALGVAAGEGRIDPVHMLTGSNATPRDVRDRLEVARVAHFATHAFANTDDKSPASAALVRNPLIGCGLALSGANSPGGTLDGETIAGLRLNGLDLTVLSACNTGVGRTIAGEGVYALRRAFHAAGCRTVVASLWAVDDLSTAALMTQFYHHLWVDEMPPEDALWRAQLDLYQAPGNIAQWAEGRRGDPLPLRVATVGALPAAPAVMRESLPRKWAGFQISMNQQ